MYIRLIISEILNFLNYRFLILSIFDKKKKMLVKTNCLCCKQSIPLDEVSLTL